MKSNGTGGGVRSGMMAGALVLAAGMATTLAAGLSVGWRAGPASAAEVVDSIREAILENYIFPEIAEKCAALLGERLADGAYADLEPRALAASLTRDLQSVSNDRHFRVRHDPGIELTYREAMDEREESDDDDHGPGPADVRRMAGQNFGFREVKILDGNVGYIDLRGFQDEDLGAPTATAAMQMVANSEAIIFDLRQNGGGSPGMVQHISSYLFGDTPVHLNSLYFRPADTTEEFWTDPGVPGKRMPDTPVYILTSRFTFSAAEEFCYNLRNLERATIVGETTGGGAHPGGGFALAPGFGMFIPTGRAINPISGDNWEGVGVKPHLSVPADDALDTAHVHALEALYEDADAERRDEMAWGLEIVRARATPVRVGADLLGQYAGRYGAREIRVAGDGLEYRRDENPFRALIALDERTFMIEGLDTFKMKFERGADGEIVRIVGLYSNGHRDASERD